MNTNYSNDTRTVLTLDAGGTSFRFFATRGGKAIAETPAVPTRGDDLGHCLATIREGFERVKTLCDTPPVAISFAFPGPADYPGGIIGDLPNFPAFRGGVALGPMLREHFGLPVYINNDGDLFAFGEAIAGVLPYVNDMLEKAGSPKRYRNLLGVTLGTGFGAGIVSGGALYSGDNATPNFYLLRNKLDPDINVEEGASIRAVRRVYAELAGIAFDVAPDPKIIEDIARGRAHGNRDAALESYRRMGEVAGDALAQAITLVDGIVAVGGGLSKGSDLFMPALIDSMNSTYAKSSVNLRRLVPHAFYLGDPAQSQAFIKGNPVELTVPGSSKKVIYDSLMRTAVGITRLGTSNAITLGAYAFALRKIDSKPISPFYIF